MVRIRRPQFSTQPAMLLVTMNKFIRSLYIEPGKIVRLRPFLTHKIAISHDPT